MIKRITLESLSNEEYIQFLTDVLSAVKNSDPVRLKVTLQYEQLLKLSMDFKAMFKPPAVSAFSESLIVFDDRRNNALKGILALVNGYTYSTHSTIKYAAQLLQKHLAVFESSMLRDGYQTQTAIIRSVLNDWNNMAEYDIALDALNLVSWKIELEMANNQFAAQYLARNQELGAAGADTLNAKRLETNTSFYTLRNNLDAYFTINNGAEPFGNIVASLNKLIDNYNLPAVRRGNTIDVEPSTPI